MRHAMKLTACLALLLAATSWAIVPPKSEPSSLASKAFFKPELYLPIQNTPLQDVEARMSALNASAWNDFFARNGKDFNVYLDQRTGAVTSVEGAYPLIPGKGVGNKVSLSGLQAQLGRAVTQVDSAVVADLVIKFIADNQAALGVDPLQLGEARVTAVTEYLWQVHIPQVVNGVSVRHSRVAATINHGNLILLGTEAWKNTSVSTRPVVTPEQAMALGGDYLGMLETPSNLFQRPELEIVPIARADMANGQTFVGALGQGYEHKLTWTYGFQRPGEDERWQVTVDAVTGDVLEIKDTNHYFDARIKGGIYPTTNIDICPNDATCGTMQPNSPMPWTDTGLAAPNNFTDSAGVFDYSGTGTVTTTLNGKYVKITDTCGVPSFSSDTGNIDMGGSTGQHDCTIAGGGPGNTPAARSCFYETNKLAEQARGWLPTNTWLTQQLPANVNLNSTCNAFWNGTSVNFYKSGGGCRNTGEIGAVFDHEWGHGIDDFDANGTLSSSSEGYADIAAIYRLQTSCVGYGFFHTLDDGCGMTPDGTGFNVNEAQTGSPWCASRCSGVRDADWQAQVPNLPQTPQNFTCSRCSSGSGPCGKQVHCSAGPTRQAAWDFVARDLRGPPYNYDSNTAFIVANKIFYQGSGNVGTWHGCDCTGGTSDGCGATNGYMQWLAADDDDGNLANGTPHMVALHAAFNRHGMACATPAPVRSGCASGPSAAPNAFATPGEGSVTLNWNAVTGANQYWVMKTEGFAGCNFGKAKVATVNTGTTYTDNEVANGRQYCYSIVAASSNACYSPGSTCTCVTPACSPPGASPATAGPSDGTTGVDFRATLDWSDVEGTKYEVQVATDADFNDVVRSALALTESTWQVNVALAPLTTYYWRVRAVTPCGGASTWSPPSSFTTRACVTLAAPSLTSPAPGATGVGYTPTLDWSDVANAEKYEVQVALDPNFTNIVAANEDLSASTFTVSTSLAANTVYYWRARSKDVCGPSIYTSASFTTANVCSTSAAVYNSSFKAPACGVSCGCNSGTLVRGRGTLGGGGFEQNASNTLGNTCVDGNSGVYRADESVEKLVLTSSDRSTIVPGSAVKLDVSVWCQGTKDRVDLFYTTDASNPTWSPLVTGLACTASGAKTFSHTFNVGSTAGNHAIRAQIRYGGLLNTCSAGSYNDRDDMVFAVSAPIAKAGTGSTQKTQGRSQPTAR
jgi:hypothetical protein